MPREQNSAPIMRDSKVYAVRGSGGMIKIGTSRDFGKRLDSLQCASPVKLQLVAIGPGDRQLEQRIHAKYRHRRTRGEWFMLSDKEVTELTDLLGGSPTTIYLPKVRRSNRTRRRQAFKGGSFRID